MTQCVLRCLVAGLAGLALSVCTVPPAAISAEPPSAERPTYVLGTTWLLTDGVYELIRIENDRYVFAASPTRQIHLTRDLVPARVQMAGRYLELDPPPKLAWPLKVGKSGTSQGMVSSDGPEGQLYTRFSWKVEAYEEVKTVAGSFKAFKVRFVFHTRPAPANTVQLLTTWQLDIWYAPDVLRIVKVSATFPGGSPTRWYSGGSSPGRLHGDRWDLMNVEVAAVDRPAPLAIVLDEPKEGVRQAAEDFEVTARATSIKGVARVTVALNGQEIPVPGGPAGAKERAISLRLKLKEGKNVLLVTASEANGETRQEARTLFYDRSPTTTAIATAPASPAEKTPSPTIVAALPPQPLQTAPPLAIMITSPHEQTRVELEAIGLAGVVSGRKGVTRVLITLNGTEVLRQEERAPQRSVAVNLPLRLREGQNTLVVTATDADGVIQQEARTVHYEKLVPLTLTFRHPADQARVTDTASVAAAVIASSKGVAKVTVTLNGHEVHQQNERTPQKSVVVTAPLTLREGVNTLALTATDAEGTVRQELRTVTLEKPLVAVAPSPAPPVRPTHDRWAVVIGIGQYEAPSVPGLEYSVADAEAIYNVLTGPVGFRKEHVLLLTDRTERKPTLRNIKWALGTFLSRSAKKGDTVLIFFAGHGAPETDPRGLEHDGLAKYLIPSDADPDDLFSTALPMDDLQTIFGRIESERVVAFIDACYSGAAGGRTFLTKRTRAGNVDDLFLERLTRSKGRAILTASRPNEVSIELSELGHGIFTYYLVEGLKGAADLNRDGIVTLQELYEYLDQKVTQKSRSIGGNQHPVMKGELEGVLPLTRVSR